jgi:nitrate reductase gamma subunit
MGINQDDFEKLNMRGIVISSMMTAFGLVVALAWKDTIKATVEFLMRDYADDETLMGMYVTAVAVTALVMGLAVLVLKVNQRAEKELERVQSFFYDDDDEDEKKES